MWRGLVFSVVIVSAFARAEPCGSSAHPQSATPYICGSRGLLLPSLLSSSEAVIAPAVEPPSDAPVSAKSEEKIVPAIVIGTIGAALAGGYVAGAYMTGDRPSGLTLGVSGGVVTGGLLGAGIALGIGAFRKDPGSLLRYILVPVLSGLAGAALGGLAAGLGSRVPGTGRTVTHVVIVSLLLAETVTLIVAR